MGSGNSLLLPAHTIVPVRSEGDFKFPTNRSSRRIEVTTTTRITTRDDDAASIVHLMKLVMENDHFRHMFYRFVEKKGKASIVQSFQSLEQLRKALTETLLRSTSSTNEDRRIELLECKLDIPETYGLCSFVVLESAQLLKDIHRQYQDNNKELSPCHWLKRILSIQENILSLLLEEFDEFILTEEFQNQRHQIASAHQRPLPIISHQSSAILLLASAAASSSTHIL